MKKLIISLTVLLSIIAIEAYAQELVINNIQVKGNRRVETETVKAFLGIPVGSRIDRAELDEAFRRTYDTGLFNDINMTVKGGRLVVEVVENASVSEVKVVGNDKIDDNKILSELKIQPRSVYQDSDVQSA